MLSCLLLTFSSSRCRSSSRIGGSAASTTSSTSSSSTTSSPAAIPILSKRPRIHNGAIKYFLQTLARLIRRKQILRRLPGLVSDATVDGETVRIGTFGRSGSPHFTIGQIFAIAQIQMQLADIVDVHEFVRQNFFHFVQLFGFVESCRESIAAEHDRKGLGAHDKGAGAAFGARGGTLFAYHLEPFGKWRL